MEVIKDAIRREVDRGGQVFFVHNRVQTIETIAFELRREMPDVSFMVGHAQMPEHHLEEVMKAFVDHEFQVLICTTIIENGIDIPNAIPSSSTARIPSASPSFIRCGVAWPQQPTRLSLTPDPQSIHISPNSVWKRLPIRLSGRRLPGALRICNYGSEPSWHQTSGTIRP
jgi:hypothetical protein